jgi:TRAP-type C4-dicarboxylate transport system permease small subunit
MQLPYDSSQPGAPGYAAPPAKGGSSKTIIIVVVVLLVLCCCALVSGGAYYLYQNGDKIFGVTPGPQSMLPFVLPLV